MAKATAIDLEIADEVAAFYADPLGFVRFAFPWGEPGPLQNYDGPDNWQEEILRDIGRQVEERGFDGLSPVSPIRIAVSSGHGIGKSVLVAWLVVWIMSTRPHCAGTITANTYKQLETRTWPQIQRWMALSITGHWFEVSGEEVKAKRAPSTWKCGAQTCREENSEAFAGQHAADSTSFYIFDEASAIPDKIWEVAEGGLTDGEPMIFAFGNPTRSSGKFYRTVFGSDKNRWSGKIVDSRTCRFTNKTQIAEWVADYGEDSDFVRVRVKGLPPAAGDLQFIDSTRVFEAQRRSAQSLTDDPLVVGVDVARGGGDNTVIRFRRGFDARSIPAIRLTGEQCRDSTLLVSKLAEILSERRPSHRVAMMFVDAALGGPVVNRLHQLGYKNVIEISFGGASPDTHQANMRAFMWQRMKDWLLLGAIDADPTIEGDLTGPGFKHDKSDKLVLESKEDMAKRGLASPDHGDALALTFAQRVAPPRREESTESRRGDDAGGRSWMV